MARKTLAGWRGGVDELLEEGVGGGQVGVVVVGQDVVDETLNFGEVEVVVSGPDWG